MKKEYIEKLNNLQTAYDLLDHEHHNLNMDLIKLLKKQNRTIEYIEDKFELSMEYNRALMYLIWFNPDKMYSKRLAEEIMNKSYLDLPIDNKKNFDLHMINYLEVKESNTDESSKVASINDYKTTIKYICNHLHSFNSSIIIAVADYIKRMLEEDHKIAKYANR